MPQGMWTLVANQEELQRSSHIVSVSGQDAYVFGGELLPREPRDNKMFEVHVNGQGAPENTSKVKINSKNASSAPSPRVGSASTVVNGKIYIFSGRGGLAMKPIEEEGQLHKYDPTTSVWSVVTPLDAAAPYPPARSYHCMCSDNDATIFLHAGCPESGRLADLWAFDLRSQKWCQLPDAPGPQRGGTSIAYHDGKLYRMNGFDGKTEQGGSLDVFDVRAISWSTINFDADGKNGPEPRSVSKLLPINVGGGTKLLTLFGERDPSSLGHAGAGKMLGDWWVYDIADGRWEKGQDTGSDIPAARGWFDADTFDETQVVVAGGLNEANERLQDVWILSL